MAPFYTPENNFPSIITPRIIGFLAIYEQLRLHRNLQTASVTSHQNHSFRPSLTTENKSKNWATRLLNKFWCYRNIRECKGDIAYIFVASNIKFSKMIAVSIPERVGRMNTCWQVSYSDSYLVTHCARRKLRTDAYGALKSYVWYV